MLAPTEFFVILRCYLSSCGNFACVTGMESIAGVYSCLVVGMLSGVALYLVALIADGCVAVDDSQSVNEHMLMASSCEQPVVHLSS